jgi:hypothetical protein
MALLSRVLITKISRRAVLWRVVKHPYEYHANDALKKPGAHPRLLSCSSPPSPLTSGTKEERRRTKMNEEAAYAVELITDSEVVRSTKRFGVLVNEAVDGTFARREGGSGGRNPEAHERLEIGLFAHVR